MGCHSILTSPLFLPFPSLFVILAPSPLPSSPTYDLLQVSSWLLFTALGIIKPDIPPRLFYKDSLFWCSLPIYQAASLTSLCIALPSRVQEATGPCLNLIFSPEMHSLASEPLTPLDVFCPNFLSTYHTLLILKALLYTS